MKVLFIGGTGNISTAVSNRALAQGVELYVLNRGKTACAIPGVKPLICDINNSQEMQALTRKNSFDVVVNWIAFTPQDIERDYQLFKGRTGQYIFISSASAYQKPPLFPYITESTPLYNPYWEYSQNKIYCETLLNRYYQDDNFPITIVRPSLTYDTVFPIAIGGWKCFTLADRLLKGKQIIIHGDGTSLWTVTHADDFAKGFVGLLGHAQATGNAFHITSDEVLTWNQIYQTIADGLDAEMHAVHIPSDFIAQVCPEMRGGLLGDKAHSAIFDNSKIKSYVPDFTATIPFKQGIARTIAWFQANSSRRFVNDEVNLNMDKVLAAFAKASV